jgi:hypothetical protein
MSMRGILQAGRQDRDLGGARGAAPAGDPGRAMTLILGARFCGRDPCRSARLSMIRTLAAATWRIPSLIRDYAGRLGGGKSAMLR